MKARWRATMLAAALAGTLTGCPSLGEIGVGPGDAGGDATSDRRAVPPPDVHSPDAGADTNACGKDLATDARNCGRCGHDCAGGDCRSGACQPYAIAIARRTQGVAVRYGVLYFTTLLLTVESCKTMDCSSSLTLMTSNQNIPGPITTDMTSAYWANLGFPVDGGYAGSIATCGLAGCPTGSATVLAPAEQRPVDLVVDSSAVYWTDAYGGLIRSCSVSGCLESPTTLVTDPTPLSGLAVDATSLFWAESTLGNVIKCPLGGCATFTPFASGQVAPAKIDVADGTVFWSTNGAVMSCPTTGCGGAPQVFAGGQPAAYALTHDATHLYWTLNAVAGKVLSCPLSGCATPTVLAEGQDSPSSVALDRTSVYWTNSGGDAVMRVAK